MQRAHFPQDMPASDVIGMVYPSGATIPAEYAAMDAVCGVIAVWTGGDETIRPAGTGGR